MRTKNYVISIILLFLLLCVPILAKETAIRNYNAILPEVIIIGQPIEVEIYQALVTGKDSVQVRNGPIITYVNVCPLDPALARVVLAQAKVESGAGLASPLARLHNNYYGMTHPGRGKLTTSLGPFARAEGRGGYASYATPEDSALDLILLLDFYGVPHTAMSADKYVRLIKSKHYFESSASNYTKNLKYHLDHAGNLLQKPL